MIVLPYIELRGRTLARRAYARGEMSEFASKLSNNFEKVYVADIDGISKNKPQLDVAQEICEEVPVLYEGGVRFASGVIDMLITGAERAVIGTATLASVDELRKAFMLSENITFKVDYRDGIVSFDPRVAGGTFLALSQRVRDVGIAEILVPKDLAVEASAARKKLGISLGVFASVTERARMEQLGVDYIVAEDFGRLVQDE